MKEKENKKKKKHSASFTHFPLDHANHLGLCSEGGPAIGVGSTMEQTGLGTILVAGGPDITGVVLASRDRNSSVVDLSAPPSFFFPSLPFVSTRLY